VKTLDLQQAAALLLIRSLARSGESERFARIACCSAIYSVASSTT